MRSEQIAVPFEGDGSGVEELAWGQSELWRAMRRQQTFMPIGYAEPLPPGTTIDTVVEGLRYWMSRYQTMRTRLRHDPDGHTRQVVHASGEVTLEVVDTDDDDDPAKVAEEVRLRHWESDYDFVDEWPVRMAVIRHRGALTHQVVVLCHLVTDGFGGLIMLRDLASRDTTPVTATQPLEQARWQRSPAGRRHLATVLRHWEDVVRSVPAQRFPGSDDRRTPRHWQVGLDSPASHLAVRAIAARTNVDASPILLTIFAVAIARVLGTNPVVTRVVASNRFRRGLADSVSPLTQTGLCVIDLAGLTFEQALARTARRAFVAYKHAYYDSAALDAAVAEVCRERGEHVDLSCFFNDRRLVTRDLPDGPPPTAGEIRAALGRGTLRWGEPTDKPSERLFANINDVPDTVDITIFADTHYVSPAGMEAITREMEAVAVEAALGGEP
jgi:hypothetical protein